MAGFGLTIFAVVTLLVMAVILMPVANRSRLPHSVLLTLFGLFLGLYFVWMDSGEGLSGGAYIAELKSLGVGAEAIFYLLLPPMIFDSAVKINVRRLIDDIGPILLLAIAGTLLSIVFIGYSLQVFSGLSIVVCLMVGAICSSTDPLPVQEVFEDAGVPKRVDLLVEGESLFSDSTALVAYALLLAMLTGSAEFTLGSGVISFLEVSVGGMISGYIFARLACWLYIVVGESQIARNTLSICLSYVCFFLVEDVFGYSGVIAVVTAALVIGIYGRAVYSPTKWSAFLDLTGQINFIAKSIVFILVGMVVPSLIKSFGVDDIILLGILTVAAFAARALSVYLLLPALSIFRLADPVDQPIKLVMFWGASRGAISLALALAILETPGIDADIARFIGTMVCSFVLLTLLVNATTMQALLKLAGLKKLDKLDLAIKDRAIFDALTELSDDITAQNEASGGNDRLLQDAVSDFDNRSRKLFDSMARRNQLEDDEWIAIALTAVAQFERRVYFGYLEDRLVSPAVARVLLSDTDDLLDGVRQGGRDGYLEATRHNFRFNWQARFAIWLHMHFNWSYFLRKELARRFERLLTVVAVMEELEASADERVARLTYRELMVHVASALGYRLKFARLELQGLRLAYPEYGQKLEQNLLKLRVARLEQQKYTELLDQAVISAEVYEELIDEIEQRIAVFSQQPELDLGLSAREMLDRLPLFNQLSSDRKQEISRLLKPRFVTPDELLIRKGEAGDAMYFIATGAVRVEIGENTVFLGSGDFFGEMALLNNDPRNASVYSEEYCRLLVLYSRDFHPLLERDSTVRDGLQKMVEQRTQGNLQ